MKQKKELKVWVANDLTHAMFKEPGTLHEMRFAQILCALVDPNAPDLRDYSVIIKPKWFASLFNISDRNIRKEFYTIADRLGKRIMIPADNPNLVLKWYGSMRLLPDGSIKVTYSPDLHPYLCSVKKYFTAFNILDTEELSSFYSVRLHWILSSWVNLKEVQDGQAIYQDLIDLRKKMGCLDKYKQPSDFIKRAVEEAVQDINAYAKDISVEYEVARSEDGKGRIEGIYFRPQRKKDLVKAPDIDFELIQAMKAVGCTASEIGDFAEKLGQDVIRQRIEYCATYSKPIKKTKLAFFRWVMNHPVDKVFIPDSNIAKEVQRKRKITKQIQEREKEREVKQEKSAQIDHGKMLFDELIKTSDFDDAIRQFSTTETWTNLKVVMKLKRKHINSVEDLKEEILNRNGMVYGAFINFIVKTASQLDDE